MRVSVLLQWSLLISRLLVTVLIRVFIAPVVEDYAFMLFLSLFTQHVPELLDVLLIASLGIRIRISLAEISWMGNYLYIANIFTNSAKANLNDKRYAINLFNLPDICLFANYTNKAIVVSINFEAEKRRIENIFNNFRDRAFCSPFVLPYIENHSNVENTI